MDFIDQDRYYLDRIRQALQSNDADTHLGQAVASLKQPFVVMDGDKWLYEGFVGMASAIRQALAAMDDSISPSLPPCLLDPATLAKLFGIPLEDFNWQGRKTDKAHSEQLTRMETKLDDLRQALEKQRPGDMDVQQDDLRKLPDCLTSRMAAEILGVDKKTLNKLRRDGFLKWRVKNPTSTRREFLYETASVLEVKNSYRMGEPQRQQTNNRRKAKTGYVPQYIKLK